MNSTILVAVYGTLKRGFRNHGLLAQAHYIGGDKLAQICLYDIGPYPGARMEASKGIDVEVYALDSIQLAELDLLEEYDADDIGGSLYTRKLLETRYGMAWVYLYQGALDGKPRLGNGAWQPKS